MPLFIRSPHPAAKWHLWAPSGYSRIACTACGKEFAKPLETRRVALDEHPPAPLCVKCDRQWAAAKEADNAGLAVGHP